VGYTDALVDNLTITVPTPEDPGGIQVDLSVTQLPNFYRFKAGGSQSVRGYAFESLSNNDIGSNHIITASVEAEFRFRDNWSAAAFFDIGNAFNDFSDPDLHKGAGVGIRWYSIAGPIRVDVAQAIDFEGRPWRIHFTIGTPLL
jgi:translocation and assembly module TamA